MLVHGVLQSYTHILKGNVGALLSINWQMLALLQLTRVTFVHGLLYIVDWTGSRSVLHSRTYISDLDHTLKCILISIA